VISRSPLGVRNGLLKRARPRYNDRFGGRLGYVHAGLDGVSLCLQEEIGQDKANRTTAVPRCGLCGKTKNLTKTECCGTWICDDEHKYVMFSYARNSCIRNHRRYTLCGYHHTEGHPGDWTDCPKCRESFETEMYVWYGTNEYNFKKLPNPPAYEPTHCADCGRVIRLGRMGTLSREATTGAIAARRRE